MTEASPRRRARSLKPRSRQPTAPPQKRALAVIGTVVAPATLLVALMYVFGLLHAYWFFRRFGVDYTLMGLTTQDYLLRSVDGLFVPLVTVSSVGLAVFWLGRCLPAAVRNRVSRVPAPSSGASVRSSRPRCWPSRSRESSIRRGSAGASRFRGLR